MGDNEEDFINKNKRMKLINLINNFQKTSPFFVAAHWKNGYFSHSRL